MSSPTGATYAEKSSGPSTDPCSTPYRHVDDVDDDDVRGSFVIHSQNMTSCFFSFSLITVLVSVTISVPGFFSYSNSYVSM